MHALALQDIAYRENEYPGAMRGNETKTVTKPVFLTVLCINADGNIVSLHDEAWRFQFIPILQKEAPGA
jgi:hypothetical protein